MQNPVKTERTIDFVVFGTDIRQPMWKKDQLIHVSARIENVDEKHINAIKAEFEKMVKGIKEITKEGPAQ